MKLFKAATLIATACAGLIAAAPASAEDNIAVAAAAASTASAEQKVKPAASKQKYCVTVEAATGSRLSRRECRTKEEWDALGLDTASRK